MSISMNPADIFTIKRMREIRDWHYQLIDTTIDQIRFDVVLDYEKRIADICDNLRMANRLMDTIYDRYAYDEQLPVIRAQLDKSISVIADHINAARMIRAYELRWANHMDDQDVRDAHVKMNLQIQSQRQNLGLIKITCHTIIDLKMDALMS